MNCSLSIRLLWITTIALILSACGNNTATTVANPSPVAHLKGAETTTTDPRDDQRLAMHESAVSDIDTHRDVPFYQISGTINPKGLTWQAHQTVTFINQSGTALDRLYFRLYPNLADMGGALTISAARVNDTAVTVQYESDNYIARIDVPAPIATDATTTVTLDFVTTVPKKGGKDLFGTLYFDKHSISLPSAYPLLANNKGGTWDLAIPNSNGDLVTSPEAMYDVTTTIPNGYTLVSTGTAIATTKTDATQTIRVVSGLQRDFMLSVTNNPHVSAVVDGTTISMYYPNDDVDGANLALGYASTALHLFNTTIGQYPFNELDMVTSNSGSFEGIEYPGIVMYSQDYFNTQPDFEDLVVHEVGHQWFYNVIGNDVQQHAWVDESMTTYTQVLYADSVHGTEAGRKAIQMFSSDYDQIRDSSDDRKLDSPIDAFDEDTYSLISYYKGALYIDAIRSQIGEQAFAQALKTYYANNRYAIVDGTAFLAAAQSACNCDIQPLYNQWVLGE
jgi:Peptidase family M1 domain